jgi:hypothetical protein
VRYKQKIDRAYANGPSLLVPAIAEIVRDRTSGFDHLEAAERPDLFLEALILDDSKPYHHLFSSGTIEVAQARMDEYYERHPPSRGP